MAAPSERRSPDWSSREAIVSPISLPEWGQRTPIHGGDSIILPLVHVTRSQERQHATINGHPGGGAGDEARETPRTCPEPEPERVRAFRPALHPVLHELWVPRHGAARRLYRQYGRRDGRFCARVRDGTGARGDHIPAGGVLSRVSGNRASHGRPEQGARGYGDP